MKKDPDKIAAIEKAISKKYGKEAIQNPKGNWNEKKEKEYIEQVKKFQEKLRKAESSAEKIEHNGFFVSKKLINKESNNPCPMCKKYTLNVRDDVCMLKFECCFDCYAKYVEEDI
tara:strand:+ start:799 stop:1143 length:345 start_codon:yes stop_codon:yes gene_type:complete